MLQNKIVLLFESRQLDQVLQNKMLNLLLLSDSVSMENYKGDSSKHSTSLTSPNFLNRRRKSSGACEEQDVLTDTVSTNPSWDQSAPLAHQLPSHGENVHLHSL